MIIVVTAAVIFLVGLFLGGFIENSYSPRFKNLETRLQEASTRVSEIERKGLAKDAYIDRISQENEILRKLSQNLARKVP